jgi:hypothetical protein
MTTKNRKPILEWTGYADDEELKNYRESYNECRGDKEDEITIEQAQTMINEDSDYWTMQWESVVEYMTELMSGRTYWRDDATHMGWQNRSGYKVFKAENGQQFIDAITPNTSDFSLTVYKYYSGFKIRIGHHDAPMGEHHIIKAITEDQYTNE